MQPFPLTLKTRDGVALEATLFEPEGAADDGAPVGGAAGDVVLLAGAIGVQQSFYRDYAAFLAEEGFTVLTFDYRGIGRSLDGPLSKVEADLLDWGEMDIAAAIDWVSHAFPEAKLLYVAHSAGGQLLGLARNNHRVAAMLTLSAPSGYWRLWHGTGRLFIALMWYVLIPVLTPLLGYFPGRRLGLGANLPPGVARNWARWGRNPHYISDGEGQAIREHYRTFRAPIHAISFADDPYAPREAVAELLSYYGSPDKEHEHLRPRDLGVPAIGHLRYFRDPRFRDTLWRRTAEWLKAHG